MPDYPEMNRSRSIVWLFAALLLLATFSATSGDEPARLTAEQRAERVEGEVRRFFQPLVDREWAQALVVGVVDERGPRVFGFGRRADSSTEPPDGDSVFEIGSVTKVFTGTLLADMAERGLVNIDDPVNKLLPADIGPLRCAGHEMRLVDLATHTSGLPRMPANWSPQDGTDPYADYTTEKLFEFLKEHAKPSLSRAVGNTLTNLLGKKNQPKWEYSNLGVGLLGTLLARKAERPYEALLLERIYRPLGMDRTRITPDAAMTARLIPGHDADGNPAKNWKFGCLAPCGGLYSTANDLLKFVSANMDLTDTPLKAAMAKTQQPHLTVNPKLDMGLNWLLFKPDVVFHNGMTGGYNSSVAFSKSQKLGVVVLADTAIGGDSGLLDQVAIAFYKTITEDKQRDLPRIRATQSVDRATLQKYAGKYTLVPLVATFTITCDDNRIYAQITGQPRLRIYPESETEFFYKAVNAQITFESDESGNVKRLVLHQHGKDMAAARQN